jgi:hypothetical protein
LRRRFALKFLPVIVSRLPTLTRIGWTRVMLGAGPLAARETGAATRAAASAKRQMVRKRRIAKPLSTVLMVG